MLTDKEILTDCLQDAKDLAHWYTMAADHCDDGTFTQALMGLATEEQQLRLQLFQFMRQRGWYNPQQITQAQIQFAQQSFNQKWQQLQATSPNYGVH